MTYLINYLKKVVKSKIDSRSLVTMSKKKYI